MYLPNPKRKDVKVVDIVIIELKLSWTGHIIVIHKQCVQCVLTTELWPTN